MADQAANPANCAVPGEGGNGDAIVVFRDVSISFGGPPVLEDVSFFVQRGKTLCILGRSGVGKSVSLRLLMGFLKPDSGSICVEGKEVTELDEQGLQEVRKRLTMVFQNGALFDSLTVRENVAFPLRERGGLEEDQYLQVVNRLLLLVGADDVADQLPASLSTGRRRAVAIARALAAQPEVVLYDEPTTMVDPIIARRLGGIIQRLKHQLGLYQHCSDPRHALCGAAGGPGSVPASGPGKVFWASQGVFAIAGPGCCAVPDAGRVQVADRLMPGDSGYPTLRAKDAGRTGGAQVCGCGRGTD